MVGTADPTGRRAHDAYHRFVRAGRWSPPALWGSLVVHLVDRLAATGPLVLDVDDTLYKKTGPKVTGAGRYRDGVRSTLRTHIFAWGLNLVVVSLRVQAPWGGCPIALPILVRLAKKGGPSTQEHAEAMLRQLAEWLPHRNFNVCCDGAYAGLIGKGLPNMTVTSRMRRNAAIFSAPPPKTGKRGRPRMKGERLPCPHQLAASLSKDEFSEVEVDCRGHSICVFIWTTSVLWFGVERRRMLTLAIVRDPRFKGEDYFIVSDDTEATVPEIFSRYLGRWSIEVCFRDVKQLLGAEDPQSWKGEGPERAATLSLWLHSAIWAWYITTFGTARAWIIRPWYPRKARPSFLDALAALRRAMWAERITSGTDQGPEGAKILDDVLTVLAAAA